MPHGRYTLTIRSIESDLDNGKEVFRADIEILPPWYLSWWAKSLYVLLLLAAGVWTARFWLMRKQLAKEQREKQLFLEQSRARMDFYNNVSQNLRQALHKIMTLATETEVLRVGRNKLQMIAEVALHIDRVLYIIMIKGNSRSADRRREGILQQAHSFLT